MTLKADALEALASYVEQWGDAPTVTELASGDLRLAEVYEHALRELAADGRVHPCGERMCRRTHREAQTWRPVDVGSSEHLGRDET